MNQAVQPFSAMSPGLLSDETVLEKNHRILIVDDNESIHDDFRKILHCDEEEAEFDEEEAEIFGKAMHSRRRTRFEMDFAFQGEEALERVEAAMKSGKRYAMVFMDVRMPPGCDGLETAVKLWKIDPDVQVVICTAYSDYSWEEMMDLIGNPERLLILKKPFDAIEVVQFAHALTEKWSLLQAARRNTEGLENLVDRRTRELKEANARLEQEIRNQRIAAERIREQAALLEKSRDAIIVRDLDDTIQFWNNGAERLYGWTAAEAIGRKVGDLLHESVLSGDLESAKRLLMEEGRWVGELTQETRDGRTVAADSHWTLVKDEGGRPKSIMAINTDVTAKKEIEAQFLRSQRMESIGALAGGIAHDLNNLLQPILLSFGFIRPIVMDPADIEILDVAEISARRAADIVKQVLLFAKGEAPNRVDLEPRQFISDIEMIANETFPKSIRFSVRLQRDLQKVKADPTQMHQVMLNLCVNARDAMPKGGALTIAASNITLQETDAQAIPGLAAGPHVLIEVSDTGTGIPPEVIGKIFEPFFTTKEVGKGTGLGLSTVFGIVKNHGGVVTVRSTPGEGTVFGIYLPSIDTEQPEETKIAPVSGKSGDGRLVLLVDDEMAVLVVTQRALEQAGYRVLAAKDGIEALEIAEQYQTEISMVLTDMMMARLDGEGTLLALREMLPGVPCMAMSGGGNIEHELRAKNAGARRFIHKPYTPDRLIQAVAELLDEAA